MNLKISASTATVRLCKTSTAWVAIYPLISWKWTSLKRTGSTIFNIKRGSRLSKLLAVLQNSKTMSWVQRVRSGPICHLHRVLPTRSSSGEVSFTRKTKWLADWMAPLDAWETTVLGIRTLAYAWFKNWNLSRLTKVRHQWPGHRWVSAKAIARVCGRRNNWSRCSIGSIACSRRKR